MSRFDFGNLKGIEKRWAWCSPLDSDGDSDATPPICTERRRWPRSDSGLSRISCVSKPSCLNDLRCFSRASICSSMSSYSSARAAMLVEVRCGRSLA